MNSTTSSTIEAVTTLKSVNSTSNLTVPSMSEADAMLWAHYYYCSIKPMDSYCLSLRLANETTFDDLDYLVNSREMVITGARELALGVYIPALLISIGLAGNLYVHVGLTSRKVPTAAHIALRLLTALNMIYLAVVGIASCLERTGVIYPPIVFQSQPACMLWPPVNDLLTHAVCWSYFIIAFSLLDSQGCVMEASTDMELSMYAFKARLKCGAVLVIMVFLNYHTTLIRDLTSSKCAISTKAGTFYRDVWPWLKETFGIYIPWILVTVSLMVYLVQKKTIFVSLSDRLLLALLTFFIFCTGMVRLIIQPYEFSLSQAEGVDKNQSTITQLYLTRQLINTALYSLSSFFIVPTIRCSWLERRLNSERHTSLDYSVTEI